MIATRHRHPVPQACPLPAQRHTAWHTRRAARRPEAGRLLAALRNPRRGFTAVVIGEPHRAFHGNQFGLTMPLLTHYGVHLWVPEVGGLIDPDNEAHDLVMSVFGGMSKGERNRVKVRVSARRRGRTDAVVSHVRRAGHPGQQLIVYRAEPRSRSAESLRLLGTLAASSRPM